MTKTTYKNWEEFSQEPNRPLHETYAKLANQLRGLRPNVHTIGIITAENPWGNQADPEFNRHANEKLRKSLIQGDYGFRQIKGRYDWFENPFVVNNISRGNLIGLGSLFSQDSVVFGSKVEKDGEVHMHFELIGTDGVRKKNFNQVLGEQDIFIRRNPESDQDNYYSEYKGRRFLIPFFGEKIELPEDPLDGWQKMQQLDYDGKKWKGGEHELPDKGEIYWKHAETNRTVKDEEFQKLRREIKESTELSGAASYYDRGRIAKKIREL